MPKRTDAEKKAVFDRLHHPDSATRQLADWKRSGDPSNPPAKVKKFIDDAQQVSIRAMAAVSPKMRKRLTKGD